MENDYKEKLSKYGILGFVTYGNSMWPFIKNKKTSVVVLKKEGRLSVYDIAFYQRENGDYVLHRVLEVLSDGYTVRGDSQKETEFVPEERTIGIVSGYYAGRKYVDCSDTVYIDKIRAWLDNPKREKKIDAYYARLRFKSRLKIIFSFGKRK